MQSTKLKITNDGSHTLYVPEIDECYHSSFGAIQESQHIFIRNAFLECTKPTIKILEVGFGSGLNAFLTLLESEKINKSVEYTSIELFPVDINTVLKLNFAALLNEERQKEYKSLHISPWNQWVEITPLFKLRKIKEDFTTINLTDNFDVFYFDAFSPEKQPEMWTKDMFDKIFQHAADKAILATYCCKGNVKRAMKAAGFVVEKIPGPIGKREILRAIKC